MNRMRHRGVLSHTMGCLGGGESLHATGWGGIDSGKGARGLHPREAMLLMVGLGLMRAPQGIWLG